MSKISEFAWIPVPVVLENGITANIYLKNDKIDLDVSVRKRLENEIIMGVEAGQNLLDVKKEDLGISFVIPEKKNWQEEAQQVFTELFLHRYISTIINNIQMPLANAQTVGENMMKYVHQITFH